MQQHHSDTSTGGVERHICIWKDEFSDDEFRVIRAHGVSDVGEDGAAYGCGPVVEGRSEVIDPGALFDICGQ